MDKGAVLKQAAEMHRLIEAAAVAVDTLPALPEGCVFDGIGINSIAIDMPFKPALFRDLRRALGKTWRFAFKTDLDSGTQVRYYRGPNSVCLAIYLQLWRQGATCRRVQVGEKTVPVFETVCS